MTIKSFRGQIADGSIDTISLSTNNGSTGYRIVKFNLMQVQPGEKVGEHIVKIFSIPQTTTSVSGVIDFSDNTLLGAGHLKTHTSEIYADTITIVFDNMTFNQDVYITHIEQGSDAVNYYIEMEQVKLDLNENTVATLKDIRNTTQ